MGRGALASESISGVDSICSSSASISRTRSTSATSVSRPVELRRLNGSLAERIVPGDPTGQRVTAAELAVFAQDRWRLGSRVTLELGLRIDREDVIERVNWSPRGGASVAVLPEGRGILRGGVGRFRQRTPLNVGAFGQFESPAW